jgi:flagellar protein FliO/FliZ
MLASALKWPSIRNAAAHVLIVASTLAATVAFANPAESVAPRLVESPLSASNLINTAVGLVVVLAVMLGLAWFMRRFVQMPAGTRGQIQVLGGVSLGAREKAVLINVEGRRLLLGVAPGRVQTLMVLDDAAESAAFAETLAKAGEMRPRSGLRTGESGS